MTGLIRKATLFGVFGLLAASAALANVPDPTTSTVPRWLYAVGIVNNATNPAQNGLPDMDGASGRPFNGPNTPFVGNPYNGTQIENANVITIKDFSGNPISGVRITINLPCDIQLCRIDFGPVPANGSILTGQQVLCPDPTKNYGTLTGLTDSNGQWRFAIVAAAKDNGTVIPCNSPGCVLAGGRGRLPSQEATIIKVAGYAGTFKTANTIAFDQDGSGIPGSNGVSALDASRALNSALGFLLGVNTTPAAGQEGVKQNLYRARMDHDQNLELSPIDAGVQLAHAFRVALIGTPASSTCTTTFCTIKPACP